VPFPGTGHRVDVVRTEVSVEYIVSTIRVKKNQRTSTALANLLGTPSAVNSSSILFTLMMAAIRSSEMSVLTSAT
jgi:hypothetical protein